MAVALIIITPAGAGDGKAALSVLPDTMRTAMVGTVTTLVPVLRRATVPLTLGFRGKDPLAEIRKTSTRALLMAAGVSASRE